MSIAQNTWALCNNLRALCKIRGHCAKFVGIVRFFRGRSASFAGSKFFVSGHCATLRGHCNSALCQYVGIVWALCFVRAQVFAAGWGRQGHGKGKGKDMDKGVKGAKGLCSGFQEGKCALREDCKFKHVCDHCGSVEYGRHACETLLQLAKED